MTTPQRRGSVSYTHLDVYKRQIGYSGTLSPDSVHHEELDEEGNPITGGDIQADEVTELVPVVDETPSGGGNPEVVENEGGYFENVEINDKLVKEEKNQ